MTTADARHLQADLKERGVTITLAAIRLLTVAQARAAMLWLNRFPSYEEWMQERGDYEACRVCGCTDDDPCDEGCEWAEANLCSACAEKMAVTS